MTIEERGALLSQGLRELASNEGFRDEQRVHLITHSFTGVDGRAAISLFGAGSLVRSLTTVCSPHLGMRLVDNAFKH